MMGFSNSKMILLTAGALCGQAVKLKKMHFTAVLFSLALTACGGNGENDDASLLPVIPAAAKIAFIADQGSGSGATAILELIRDEKADLLMHQGDFDYGSNPDAWMQQIDNILGPAFPVFATVGNHDRAAWPGYQAKLLSRLEKMDEAYCTGDLGINSSCTYRGIFFVLSGIGTRGADHVDYLKQSLAATDANWKICSWHRNQHLMQVGGKPDEVGWEAYETCRLSGAIIATGHEHSYSRTHLMSSFEFQTIASDANHLVLSEGESFAFVSGLGGKSIRRQYNYSGSNPWWASVYTADENARYGALFCTFNLNDNENEAACYFKDIAGNIIDAFTLSSKLPQVVKTSDF